MTVEAISSLENVKSINEKLETLGESENILPELAKLIKTRESEGKNSNKFTRAEKVLLELTVLIKKLENHTRNNKAIWWWLFFFFNLKR